MKTKEHKEFDKAVKNYWASKEEKVPIKIKTTDELIFEQYPDNSSARKIIYQKLKAFGRNPSVAKGREIEDLIDGVCADISEGDAEAFYQRGEPVNL